MGKKRCATGYNLYIKDCTKDKPFPQCLSERGWGKLSDEEKAKWNSKARDLCDV